VRVRVGHNRYDLQTMTLPKPRLPVSTLIFFICGIWLIGLGLYFIFLRPPLLPEDLRYMGASVSEIQSVMPELKRWLDRVFTVMGGFMTGAGLLTIATAGRAFAGRKEWRWILLTLAGLFSVGTMSLTNFQLNSDFKWPLLLPSLLWGLGLVLSINRESDGSGGAQPQGRSQID